jgi:hypothetical protein
MGGGAPPGGRFDRGCGLSERCNSCVLGVRPAECGERAGSNEEATREVGAGARQAAALIELNSLAHCNRRCGPRSAFAGDAAGTGGIGSREAG